MRSAFDVVIIGAGPAGSAAAILLARAGLSVVLIEKQRFPRRKVCGECFAASNLPLLDALGVGEAFEACAGPELRQVGLMRADSTIVADLPAASHQRHRWGRALGRETFDALLLEHACAAGARLLQPWRVIAIQDARGDQPYCVEAFDSRTSITLRAGIVIAANGSWEPLPSMGQRRRTVRRASDLFAFKANYLDASLRAGLLPVLSFNGGYGGMVVADDGVTTVACCLRRDRLFAARRAAPGLAAGETIEALLTRECAGVRAALRTASRVGPWIAAGPLQTGGRVESDAAPWRIGNAAGEAHPILGEGISMALQSAFLLCTHLLATPAPARGRRDAWRREVGRAYAGEWRRAFEPRMLLAATFAHVAMRRTPSAALLALTRVWPNLLTHGARWGGKVESAVHPSQALPRAQEA